MISPSISSVQNSTTCSLSSISLNSNNVATGIVYESKQDQTIAIMDIVCEEQSKNRKFCFPKQKVVLQNEQSVVNLKKTFELSDALKIVLTDSVLFKFDEKDTQTYIGIYNLQSIEDPEYQLLLDISEANRQSNQVHLSFYRKKDISKDKVALKISNQCYENTPKFNRKRNLEDLDSNSSQITFVHIDNNQSITRKDSCLSQNSNQANHQATNSHQEFESSYKKKKLNSSNPQNIPQAQNSSVGFKTEFEDASSEQKDYSSNKSNRKEEDKASQKKSQERTIKEALEMVCKWRDLQDFYKTNNITKDYQSVADEIGISKKTLDYYYLELRTAEYFCFDFDSNLDKKMGILRDYIQESKKNFQNQFSTHKIPRNSTLKYRIPQKYADQSCQQTNNQGQMEKLQSNQYSQQLQTVNPAANQDNFNFSNNSNTNNQQTNIQTQNFNSNFGINKNLNSSTQLNQKCFYDQQIILPSLPSPNQQQPQQQYKETQLNQSNFATQNTYPNSHNIIQNASNQQNIHHINQNNTYTNSTNYYNDHSYTQIQTSQLSSQQQQYIPNNEIYQNFFNNNQNEYPMGQQRISFQLQDQNMDSYQQPGFNHQSSSQGAFQDSLMQINYNNSNNSGNQNNFNSNNNQNGRIHSCQQILHSFI